MPTVRIPLVGSYSQRGLAGAAALALSQDQRFLNCTFDVISNPTTGMKTIYVEKRPGWGAESIVAAGEASTGVLKPQSFDAAITAFGATNSTVYVGGISVGTITGRALHLTETIVSSLSHVMIKSSDGTGWYYVDGAKDQTSYVGDTHTNTVIDGIASTTGMYIGQKLSGTGIVAGTRIATITSSTEITVDTATTATNAAVTITKEPIAKIIDADFVTTGSSISAFAEMDGYLFYTTTAGSLYNSDLNSVTSYSATGFLSPNMSPDPPVAVARHKNMVIVLGGASIEAFYNAGNATGSPLTRSAQFFDRVGTIDQRSVTFLGNDIYFVSTPHEGDLGVYRIRGMQAQKISPPHVDRILGTVSATNGAIYASAFTLGGYSYASFYVSLASDGPDSMLLLELGDKLLLESADDILLEDTPAQTASFHSVQICNLDLGIWSEWDCSEATFIDGAGSGTTNTLLATSRCDTGGKVWTINPTAAGQLYTDDGSAFSLQVRTSRLDFGTSKRKFIREVRLIGDTQSSGTATLEANDNDYDSDDWKTLGSFDMTSMQPRITRCGSHKGGRSYRVTHSANTAFRAEALEIVYDEGTS